MKLFLGITLSLFSYFSSAQEVSDFSIGDRITMHSEILDEERVLNVYLPYGYSPDSSKTYPVIYLLDGSAYEDFIHVAGIVQFGSYSWINMIPETIVVGIENVNRNRDSRHPKSWSISVTLT